MTDGRRVVLVDTEMGKVLGGAQTFLADLVPALEEVGWKAEVLVEGPPEPEYAVWLRDRGVDVRSSVWRWPTIVEDAARELATMVNDERPEVFVVSVSSGVAWAALPLIRSDIATMALIHSDDEVFYEPLRHYRDVVDHVVAVSKPICERLVQMGFVAEVISTVPYGVPIGVCRSPSSDAPLSVAFVGRLSERDKNISTLARAVELTDPSEVIWKIAGEGPEERQLRQLVPRIEMLGHLDRGEVGRLLAATDCLVLTSTGREGTPLAILEATAHGVVPVVSDIPAHRQMVDDEVNGVMFPIQDAAALASALSRLNDNRALLRALGEAAWSAASTRTPETMAVGYAAAFIAAAGRVRSNAARRPPIELMDSCRSRWPPWARRTKARVARLCDAKTGWRA